MWWWGCDPPLAPPPPPPSFAPSFETTDQFVVILPQCWEWKQPIKLVILPRYYLQNHLDNFIATMIIAVNDVHFSRNKLVKCLPDDPHNNHHWSSRSVWDLRPSPARIATRILLKCPAAPILDHKQHHTLAHLPTCPIAVLRKVPQNSKKSVPLVDVSRRTPML